MREGRGRRAGVVLRVMEVRAQSPFQRQRLRPGACTAHTATNSPAGDLVTAHACRSCMVVARHQLGTCMRHQPDTHARGLSMHTQTGQALDGTARSWHGSGHIRGGIGATGMQGSAQGTHGVAAGGSLGWGQGDGGTVIVKARRVASHAASPRQHSMYPYSTTVLGQHSVTLHSTAQQDTAKNVPVIQT